MNRNRVKGRQIRNGHTIYLASKVYGIVDKVRVKTCQEIEGGVFHLVGTVTMLMTHGSEDPGDIGILSEPDELNLYLFYEELGSPEQIVTFCENKAKRFASYYNPRQEVPTEILEEATKDNAPVVEPVDTQA